MLKFVGIDMLQETLAARALESTDSLTRVADDEVGCKISHQPPHILVVLKTHVLNLQQALPNNLEDLIRLFLAPSAKDCGACAVPLATLASDSFLLPAILHVQLAQENQEASEMEREELLAGKLHPLQPQL